MKNIHVNMPPEIMFFNLFKNQFVLVHTVGDKAAVED